MRRLPPIPPELTGFEPQIRDLVAQGYEPQSVIDSMMRAWEDGRRERMDPSETTADEMEHARQTVDGMTLRDTLYRALHRYSPTEPPAQA